MRQRGRHLGQRERRGLFSRIAYAFRERQIYLRSEGEVQFITLRPWVQVAVMFAFCAGLFWVAYATVNIAFKDQILALKERNEYRARLEYEDRITELRSTIDRLNRRLMLDQRAYLAKVDEVRAEQDKLVDRHERLAEFFQNGWLPRPPTSFSPATRPSGDDATQQPEKQGAITPRGSIISTSDVAVVNLVPPLAQQQFATEFTTAQEALQPLNALQSYMNQMETREAGLLSQVIEYMETRNAELGQVYRTLGIDAGKVASTSGFTPDNVGGPFIAASSTQLGSSLLATRVNDLADRLETWARLRYEASHLPLTRPMPPEHETTSGFGLRKDPFRGIPAMHAGIDFRGPVGSPVMAAAPGTVLKAGRSGGYGNLVELRHENGVTTRYAHLSMINVRTGQKVQRGDMIGKLGNTGRSTGPHLHYETRVSGRAIDPTKFWKARDVLQEITR